MIKFLNKLVSPAISLFFLLNMSNTANADTTVSAEVSFIFNTFLFLICGFLVMFMAAGFAMLESGMVTSKSVSVICAKNIGLFSIAAIMFWLFGYNLAYGIPEGGYIGKFLPWSDSSKIGTGYADGSDWYFQMVFCATTVSIVSGTMAERVKLWPFFLFAAILSGILYPIVMGWQWGGGWLAARGFSDFAGSTLVHSTGGAAALAGVLLLGPRLGRFTKSGSPAPLKPFAASSIVPMASWEPPLKPNQPNHRMNTPIVTSGIEEAANGFTGLGAPAFANLPILGPSNIAPAKAAAPPVE